MICEGLFVEVNVYSVGATFIILQHEPCKEYSYV